MTLLKWFHDPIILGNDPAFLTGHGDFFLPILVGEPCPKKHAPPRRLPIPDFGALKPGGF